MFGAECLVRCRSFLFLIYPAVSSAVLNTFNCIDLDVYGNWLKASLYMRYYYISYAQPYMFIRSEIPDYRKLKKHDVPRAPLIADTILSLCRLITRRVARWIILD